MNRIKPSTIILLSLGLFFLIAIRVYAEDIDNPFPIPGHIQGTGTFFEITNSEYLNGFLQSSEEITVLLESVPKTISLTIEASSVSTSTTLTLSNLEPDKTYYKYEDSYKNEVEFTTDQNGKYIFTQGLIKPHHIWFQEIKSTIFIPEDCSTYGIWDPTTLTCTLNQDLTQSVEITQNNVVLDYDGHKVVGTDTGYGIYLNSKTGITLKNIVITDFSHGVSLFFSNNNILKNIIAYSNIRGISLESSSNNTLISIRSDSNDYGFVFSSSSDNILNGSTANLSTGAGGGIEIFSSSNNQIINNTANSNYFGIYVALGSNNTIQGNVANSNSYGIYLYSNSSNRIINNTASNASTCGICLWESSNNLITDNSISYGYGYFNNFRGSYHNNIYHNNFIKDAWSSGYIYYGEDNTFDNGYPSGGNYWSDYTGIDEKSGENQDQPGSDGIGDTPYTFYYMSQDRYPFMNESGWELLPERWSFAIITDLHIGDGFLDYGTLGWNDDSSGQEPTSPTRNLRNIVAFINSHKKKDNITFVIVDGDFTDSAELSEMNKAKEILEDLKVPWIPIIGNHDIWPYTVISQAPEIDKDIPGTDKFFNDIFSSQYEKLDGILQNWEKADTIAWNSETDPNHFSFFQNFAFDYNNYHFIGLDFNYRDDALWGFGVKPEGELYNFSSSSWDWFVHHLNDYLIKNPEGKENIILFSHHPFRKVYWREILGTKLYNEGFSDDELNTINNFLKGYKDRIAFQFAGHSHDNEDNMFFDEIVRIIETGANIDDPFARIVQFYPDGKIDYSEMLGYGLTAKTHSPVDLEIIDPDGLKINKQINEILGAEYIEEDIDGDGDLDDWIGILDKKLGDYKIKVIPEPDATPEDTYTLEVSGIEDSYGYVPILLVEDNPISEIPVEPYLVESKERKVTQITYTGELNGQYSDQINLSAVLNDTGSSPLANETVNFEIGEQSISAITNESGIASAVLSLNQIPGTYYLLEASFAGNENYLPSADSKYFEILKENTIINVIEKEGFVFDEVILEAEIKDDDGQTPLPDAEIEFKINSRTLGIVKIDEEGIATISWQVDLIPKEITENYLIEVIFTGNDYYQPAQGIADFILKSAKWLKQDAILELEKAKTGNKKFDKEIDRIILFINQSLDENLWVDASHLVFFEKGKCENLNLEKILNKDELDLDGISLKCLKSGIVVFYYERMATKLMMSKPVFKAMIGKLVKADKLLAQVSLFDAKNTPIKNPKLQKVIDGQLKKAEEEIKKAEIELQRNKPDRAITRLSKSWLHSQLAIKLANL